MGNIARVCLLWSSKVGGPRGEVVDSGRVMLMGTGEQNRREGELSSLGIQRHPYRT